MRITNNRTGSIQRLGASRGWEGGGRCRALGLRNARPEGNFLTLAFLNRTDLAFNPLHHGINADMTTGAQMLKKP